MSRFTIDDYEAAAVAVCKAIQLDADIRKANGSKSWSALPTDQDFHSRCVEVAAASARWRLWLPAAVNSGDAGAHGSTQDESGSPDAPVEDRT